MQDICGIRCATTSPNTEFLAVGLNAHIPEIYHQKNGKDLGIIINGLIDKMNWKGGEKYAF